MYLIFIPDLVSIEFYRENELKSIFEAQYNLYGVTNRKLKFHFQIKFNTNKEFFKKLYKNSLYTSYSTGVSKSLEFFYKKKLYFTSIDFAYDSKNRIFYFNENKLYKLFFSNISLGEFYYSKNIIREIINVVLFLKGYITLNGFGLIMNNNKVFLAVVPRNNGKTTFVTNILKTKEKIKFISDNQIIINFDSMRCFPNVPIWSSRKKNSIQTYKILSQNTDKILKKSINFEKIFFSINQKSNSKHKLKYEDYILGIGGTGTIHLMIMDYLMLLSLGDRFISKTNQYNAELKKLLLANKIIITNTEKYNYDRIKQ